MGPLMCHIPVIARYVWALPATFVGLLLSLVALVLGARGRIVEGAVEVAGGRIDECLLLLPRHCRFGAITFGHVIIGVDHETLAHHRGHEHVHVRQYERWGVLFFPLYLSSSVLQIARGRDPYLSNSFEREAFAMNRHIVGFHEDEEQHWVAELECGHNQHVRHQPPWSNRPWVVTAEGRKLALGNVLNCKKCDLGAPRDRRD